MKKLYFETMVECERIVRESVLHSNDSSINYLEKYSNLRQQSNALTSSTNFIPSKLAATEILKLSGIYSD